VLTYQRNKVWRDEVSLWKDVVQKSSQKARPYNNLGNAYIMQGDFAQAMVDFNKAIELNPNFGFAYCNRAASYLRQGDFNHAIDDYNKAINNDPEYTRAYWGRATTYYDLRKYDKAWADVRKIQEMGTPIDLERIQPLLKALKAASGTDH